MPFTNNSQNATRRELFLLINKRIGLNGNEYLQKVMVNYFSDINIVDLLIFEDD